MRPNLYMQLACRCHHTCALTKQPSEHVFTPNISPCLPEYLCVWYVGNTKMTALQLLFGLVGFRFGAGVLQEPKINFRARDIATIVICCIQTRVCTSKHDQPTPTRPPSAGRGTTKVDHASLGKENGLEPSWLELNTIPTTQPLQS